MAYGTSPAFTLHTQHPTGAQFADYLAELAEVRGGLGLGVRVKVGVGVGVGVVLGVVGELSLTLALTLTLTRRPSST